MIAYIKPFIVSVRARLLMKFDASKIMLGHPGAPSVNIKWDQSGSFFLLSVHWGGGHTRMSHRSRARLMPWHTSQDCTHQSRRRPSSVNFWSSLIAIASRYCVRVCVCARPVIYLHQRGDCGANFYEWNQWFTLHRSQRPKWNWRSNRWKRSRRGSYAWRALWFRANQKFNKINLDVLGFKIKTCKKYR